MVTDHPDWTHPVTITGGTVDIGTVAKVTVIETINAGNVNSLVANQQGTILQTGGRKDTLHSASYTMHALPSTISITILASEVLRTYEALLIEVSNSLPQPTGVSVTCVWVSAGPTPGTIAVAGAFGPNIGFTGTASYNVYARCILPGTYDAGIAIPLKIAFSSVAPQTSSHRTITVSGLTSNPGVQLRSDGRAYPIGSHDAYLQLTTTETVGLIAAPTPPLRIMVRSVAMVNNYAGAYGVLTAGGVRRALIYGMSPYIAEFETGLLLPPGTSLNAEHNNTDQGWFMATYDLVV